MNPQLKEVVDRIQEKYNPVSIFLYGSRARGDSLESSDYEVGVLYRSGSKISRSELKDLNPYSNIVVYPFEYESILQHRLDTPFPEKIYLRDLSESAETVVGEDVIGKIPPSAIRTIDALQTLVFQTGIALAAILSYRQKDFVTAKAGFSKSALFSARCLVILESKKFPLTYEAILRDILDLDIGEYKEVVQHAMDVRKGAEINPAMLFKNLSFQNQFIKPRIIKVLEEKGDVELLSVGRQPKPGRP